VSRLRVFGGKGELLQGEAGSIIYRMRKRFRNWRPRSVVLVGSESRSRSRVTRKSAWAAAARSR